MRSAIPLLLAASALWAQQWPPQRELPPGPADTLYYNGKIVTMWPDHPVVESMTVAAGRILAIGATQSVGRGTGPRTRQVNLRGRTVVPGLIDSHVHPLRAALAEREGPIPALRSFQDLRTYVEEAAGAPSDLVFVPQVYPTRLRERRYPNRWEIDAYSGDRPVMFDNGYAAVLNSAALRLAGITPDTADPENGKLVRDADGEPTGLIVGARQLVAPLLRAREFSGEEREEALEAMQRAYSRVGLTSVVDRSESAAGLRTYQDLWRRGALRVRTSVTRTVNAERPLSDVLAEIEALGPATGFGDAMLRIGSLKILVGGGVLLGTAPMREPSGVKAQFRSFDDTVYRGALRIRPSDLRQIIERAARLGWQVTAHTAGGGSTEVLLDAYAAVGRQVPLAERRFTLTHAHFLSGAAIRRAAALGIVADMQPAWYHFDGPALAQVLGPRRMATLQPYRTILDAGVVVAGGSGHMIKFDAREAINPYDPFLGVWMAATRIASDGEVYSPEQRITREEALKMWTWNAAYLTFEEDVKGSLEPGKYADFAVLDRDIMTCPVDELRDIRVLETVLGGRTVFKRQ